jgi:signal transduction histidine kinase
MLIRNNLNTRIVGAHSGSIDATSSGEGTRFSIRLRIASVAAAAFA